MEPPRLTDRLGDLIREAVHEATPPVLLHCTTGRRSGVFGLLASFVNLQVTDARFLPAERLNPLSFGSLLGLAPQGATTVERTLMALDVTILWSIVLQILGYQAFTQRSVVTSTIVVLGPLAVIVLIASLVALT